MKNEIDSVITRWFERFGKKSSPKKCQIQKKTIETDLWVRKKGPKEGVHWHTYRTKKGHDWSGVRTHESVDTATWVQRLRPLGHLRVWTKTSRRHATEIYTWLIYEIQRLPRLSTYEGCSTIILNRKLLHHISWALILGGWKQCRVV